ncbi:MAG: hypothetical protein U0667_12860 [Chloroflexota bacterium]
MAVIIRFVMDPGLALVAVAQDLPSPGMSASASPSPRPSNGGPTSRDGIEVPTEVITPLAQCMLDSGMFIAEVHQPPVPGATPFLVWGSSIGDDAGWDATLACRDRYAPYQPKTEAEIREIYTRWVSERDCLIRLGYQPQEPPSEETFVEQWKTGPWMPIDGVPYSTWTDEEYQTAKVECGLEMYDR